MSLKYKFKHYRPSLKLSTTLLTGSSRKSRIVFASALFLAVCAFGAAGVAPIEVDTSNIQVKAIAQELALPSLQQQITKLQDQDQLYVAQDTMRAGDTLASLMTRLGIDDAGAANFIKTDSAARSVLRLPAGSTVQAQTAADGNLQWLRASLPDTTKTTQNAPDNANNIVITRRNDKFSATQESVTLEKRIEMHSGVIRTSLFAATDAADIPDTVSSQLIDIFGTNINFANDLRRGDRFNIAYETFWQNGQFVRTGKILAGEFINGGKTYQSVWFDDPKVAEGGGYYGFDGKSLKQAFLKSPITYTRISSGFSMRLHPVLGTWKQHAGVDFAAATGTPIRAASDGVVDFAGVQNGYGNVVILKHPNNIATVYGHMSRFAALRKGNKV
ncbi:MAG: M23 family metallopeptidase, partial [Glaciimonas sp.]|nr:M23 family metallopeptidase [Glaciimonas sp.]